jgi:hypothetical protein
VVQTQDGECVARAEGAVVDEEVNTSSGGKGPIVTPAPKTSKKGKGRQKQEASSPTASTTDVGSPAGRGGKGAGGKGAGGKGAGGKGAGGKGAGGKGAGGTGAAKVA